jgi:hypothetical protein
MVGLMCLRYLGDRLLYHRVPGVAADAFFYVMTDLINILAVLVVVEIARRAFAGAGRREWIAGTLALLAVGVVVMVVWGPWPSFKTLFAGSELASTFRVMSLFGDKTRLFFCALYVQLGLLVLIFGRKFKPGWHSHAQQLAIGFSLPSLSQLVVEGTSAYVDRQAAIYPPDAYKGVTELLHWLMNANAVILLVVLVGLIVCFWIDEPGTK